ncbi:glycosyltransferase family 2 protein [Carnobacterium gallinarum]|uniref:glycosyltransferase family 2 protein n=1 Tax=Carnobacterium gallinarum TaxID=2749 RepID=UPI0005548F4E|nr:glycosyltransferase family 2 protein [Carnobacterium gallinarum]
MKIMAVVITYNPDEQVYANIKKLRKQINSVLVVDNSSLENHFILEEEGINIIHNERNLGIAEPLNMGLKTAIENNVDWLFTFDQDSEITDNFVEEMLLTAKLVEENEQVIPVLISPTYIHPDAGIEYDNSKSIQKNYAIVDTAMTSGNLLNVNKLAEINVFFRTDYFIDFVDHEFCFHLEKLGYPIIQSFRATLIHSLGEVTEHKFLGKTLITTNHNPVRRYYITRNRLDVYRTYFSTQREWIKIDFFNSFMEFVKICLCEKQKFLKILNIFRGTKDSLLNKMGPYRYHK